MLPESATLVISVGCRRNVATVSDSNGIATIQHLKWPLLSMTGGGCAAFGKRVESESLGPKPPGVLYLQPRSSPLIDALTYYRILPRIPHPRHTFTIFSIASDSSTLCVWEPSGGIGKLGHTSRKPHCHLTRPTEPLVELQTRDKVADVVCTGRYRMLNAKALSELLTRNRDERLCKQWFLMTPNGTLLAHSQSTLMKDLRKQVAQTALTWQEYDMRLETMESIADPTTKTTMSNPQCTLQSLIIESENSNVLVRRLQPQLLLVMVGGVPARKPMFESRITTEGPDGEPLHDSLPPKSALDSRAANGAPTSVLDVHRRKLDAMATAIMADLDQTGFKMPEESSNRFF